MEKIVILKKHGETLRSILNNVTYVKSLMLIRIMLINYIIT